MARQEGSQARSMSAQLLHLAIGSRLFLVGLAVLFNFLVLDYDTSTKLHYGPPISAIDAVVCPVVSSFDKWDAVYFLKIAAQGYEFEQFHAFYPILPFATRAVHETVLRPLHQVLQERCSLCLSAILLSNLAFIVSVMLFFRISSNVLKSDNLAFKATLLLILGPANIFLLAPYTEAVFAALAFAAIHLIQLRWRWTAACLIGLASATRSNGLLVAGYLGYDWLSRVLSRGEPVRYFGLDLLFQLGLSASGHLGFMYYGYLRFCSNNVAARPWCWDLVPNIYSFVQSHYWGVGLFKYYRFHQIPNFLLAAPILGLSFACTYSYCSHFYRFRSLYFGGRRGGSSSQDTSGFFSIGCVPYILHLAALSVFALLVAHVQISTRLLAACPPLYWYAAHICTPKDQKGHQTAVSWASLGIVFYFVTFSLVGPLLFSNFYPWT